MNLIATMCALAMCAGFALLTSWLITKRRRMWRQIVPFVVSPGAQGDTGLLVSLLSRPEILRRLEAPWCSDSKVNQLLGQAQSPMTLQQFRLRQASFTLFTGVGTSTILLWDLAHSGHVQLPLLVVLSGLTCATGMLCVQALKQVVSRRALAIEFELPHTLELLAFTMSAGEPLLASIYRVAQNATGVLQQQLLHTLRVIALGKTLAQGLDHLSGSTSSVALERAIRAIQVAIERGTPLAEVLRAQAHDSREHHKRRMIELAAKKETTMMIPVVFLVLPLIVAVAIYPGLIALNLI